MSKFKVGDIVKVTKKRCGHRFEIGQTVRITQVTSDNRCESMDKSDYWYLQDSEIELATKEEKTMRTFRLLKDSPELKKGALVRTLTQNGVPVQYVSTIDGSIAYFNDVVEKQPQWFVEVFNPAEQWLTKEELAKFNATLKPAKKRGRPVGSKNKKKTVKPVRRPIYYSTYRDKFWG